MADLITTITERIVLPNGNVESTKNQKIISGVNQIERRVDTIATGFSGSGIEILRFVDSEEQSLAGSFVKSDVKYIRITHISGSGEGTIYLIKSDLESTLFHLSPGKSLVFNDAEMNASSTVDYVDESYVDETYYSDFTALDIIKAKASGSNIQLEYFVAST